MPEPSTTTAVQDRSVVQRHQIADYLNVGTASAEKYVLMGVGFTTIDEKPNAQNKSKKYVHEKASSTSITSYQTEFSYESDLIKSQEAVIALYKTGRDHKTGSDAVFDYVRVDLWNGTAGTTFPARKFSVANSVSEISGEDDMNVKGTLYASGDPIEGTFDTATKKFTPGAQA